MDELIIDESYDDETSSILVERDNLNKSSRSPLAAAIANYFAGQLRLECKDLDQKSECNSGCG